MDKTSHPYFVPDDTQGNRRDTATLLVGTATEHSIPQREVAATQGGFRISEAVYKALGWDEEDEATQQKDSVGDPDARMIPGEVVTGQVPVTTPDEGTPDTEEVPDEEDAEDDTEDDTEDETEVQPYSEWEYTDLKAEVKRRGITTENQQADTLVAALSADDEAVNDDPADDES